MVAQRIETYLHSDSIAMNKGGCMVLVTAQTDFATRTPDFQNFSRQVAMLCYAEGSARWSAVVAMFPELEAQRMYLESKAGLGEKIAVEGITIFKPDGTLFWFNRGTSSSPR